MARESRAPDQPPVLHSCQWRGAEVADGKFYDVPVHVIWEDAQLIEENHEKKAFDGLQ